MVETDIACSQAIKKYFDYLDKKTQESYLIASDARELGYDPAKKVEITLAKNMAERVVGIIGVVAPQIVESTVVSRIIELEKQYGSQDWRIAFIIALEIAQQKHCSFSSKLQAIEVGVRTGFAYVTVGVVSSPLEGLTSIEIKKRRDGQGEYFRLNYAGPIRNAGGTAAAVSVLIADYVRKQLGYAKYDPTEKEIKRCYAELEDYHQFVANLQYFPYKEETEFLMKNIPVEIAGDPSEKRELSNAGLKDLPRIETNLLRSGYCLIHSSCIPLKAPKLWKKLSTWGKEMEMEDWNFLEEHIKLQKEFKAQSSQKKDNENDEEQKIKPDGVFVQDIVGGRPVLGHPMKSGGFRLRYGRGRASGYSGQSIHPATMSILEDYIATGTQLKVERPGKAAAFTPCNSIEGPIVKLTDGSVVRVRTAKQGAEITNEIEEIIYLGDVLVNYGDFFNRAHVLIPAGYCEEYWALEVKEQLNQGKEPTINKELVQKLLTHPLTTEIDYTTAKLISQQLGVPLHPQHLFFYKEITPEQLFALYEWAEQAVYALEIPKLSLPYDSAHHEGKRALELLGVEHYVKNGFVHIKGQEALALAKTLHITSQLETKHTKELLKETYKEGTKDTLGLINSLGRIIIKDKSGIFIGSRMGRPEKAKMRKLTGSPNGLFPVGEDGGRLRSFQSALLKKKISASFPVFICPNCKNKTPLSICEMCESETIRQKIERQTKEEINPEEVEAEKEYLDYKEWNIPINSIFEYCLQKLDTKIYPDLIKGVRGTVGSDHTPEHPIKAILRAKHGIAVNKDGTVRYDASELTLTHFKPKEIGTSITKLKELGYTHDVYGQELVEENQILELIAQDLVLPACPVSPEEGSDQILLRTSQCIDEMLVKLYNQSPYYNAKTKEDLVGHLIIGLAPHTSAGTVGRIIGFSKTQGMLAHPLYHAAMRRDCDGDEGCFFLILDAFLNFSKKYLGTTRGSTMDAPIVLTTHLNPAEVDDMAFDMDIASEYPLEFYRACEAYKYPWEVKIQQIKDVLFTPQQFEGMMFTHDTDDINAGVLCSAYKMLPSMAEKIAGQMSLAVKIRATETSDVARLVIDKHFIRDTKGNLRKFSLQKFRCVSCNEKYRRPPLIGKCTECGGKIIFTISEGSVKKYLEMSIELAEKYAVSDYLKESLYLTRKRIEDVFGKDKEKQLGLGEFA